MSQNIRPAKVAGSFYPADKDKFLQTIRTALNGAGPFHHDGQVLAVMAPHAGYMYSAAIAAHAYQALATAEFDTLVIIGHDFGRNAPGITAIFPSCSAFDTPLGPVSVDVDYIQALRKGRGDFIVHDGVHAQEHTIEIHLPFIKHLKPNVKIVPILFGEVSAERCVRLADALQACAGERNVMILASTDLSHYPNYNDAKSLDEKTLELVTTMDLKGLAERQAGKGVNAPNTQIALCAMGGVGTAMVWAARKGADAAPLLAKGNSGDVKGGDLNRVVGYGAVAFVRTGKGAPFAPEAALTVDKSTTSSAAITSKCEKTAPEFSLSAAVQKELLDIARSRLAADVEDKSWRRTLPPTMPELQEKAAVFVTLTRHGRLRGCIGTTAPVYPLAKAVSELAHSAAFEDTRFTPLTKEELADTHIEISVLSPLKAVTSADEIVPFKHGVVIRANRRSGLFLPQVWEQIPNKEQFLSILCQEKAGLPSDAWRQTPPAELSVFTVFAFEEEQTP